MKRFLLSFVFVLLTFNSLFAQRDTDHWIAPYYNSGGTYSTAVYLSTDSVTPFAVNIFSNNVQINTAPIMVSKNNPVTYDVANFISTTSTADGFKVLNKGLYLKGASPFYCTLRMAQLAHGEIVTSKGKAGIGKQFYVANTPYAGSATSLYSFTAGVLATEDATTVTVSWPGTLTFFGQPATPPSNPYTFTLNKGQSFIFAGNATSAAPFMGAKITSDKPITLTNGNMNGNFGNAPSGSDAILDQSVPTERLGSTFAMVRTLSSNSDLEGGIVIATEDNTQIFLNGSTTPAATINQGQWYRILGDAYQLQGTNGHYNMLVSTSKNTYLYQLVSVDNSNATCGFNYIPPLNCFLPRKIDEIGKVNEMPNTSSAITLKLNILTETGATVTYTTNGGAPITPTAAQGPYPLQGNTNWVTYAIEGVTGNLAVQSTKAVTAGVNGGYSTAGYGGYFAGFNSVPVIAKQTGDCVPGIVLEVESGYDGYQWFLNGVAITGAVSNTYTPVAAGNYTVTVSMGTCTPLTTPIYKVYTCLKQTVKNLNICGSTTITPAFTSSTQTPVAGTVSIITQPSHGTATVNTSTGVISYVPTPGYLGPDTIVYQFCGNAAEFVDCEKVTLNLTLVPFVVNDKTLTSCQYTDKASFDLTTANVIDYTGVTKTYYPTLNDLNANQNIISNPTAYLSAGGFVYVKVTTPEGCKANAKITLIAIPIKPSAILVDKTICIDARTNLDAGPGYTSYLWNTGATTPSILGVPVGEYWVKLENNGCFVIQTVKVLKAQEPVITTIDINNTTATVNVSGGKAPYKYAVDTPGTWQDSNVFTGLSRGQHIFYVKDSYDCAPVAVEVTVPNLINAITPNGDNVNDFIDYSALKYKDNLSFVIYDRYGNKIFTGDKFNDYKWDGKFFEKGVVTGTYWYHINWNEPNAQKTPIKYTGWILVKNRE
ncbi:hypothetical protein ASG31_17890 [Chryseobacterium sp. Leaf404]|uniref:T9SS type B sorting domain-containing protein n=1 Tax=unclassified Chryseobacterium TaxID=2593645 RepID=UPI0006FB8FDE|nr:MULTISPECIES: gliding motility-associated C-terminal domain-containing protein [unclassified Chryseobacterium]KQT19286.1 hypothetical protein ASG31_17890 [Chryseobacterium sp. Leaf404]